MPSNADPFVLAVLHRDDLLAEAASWRRAHPGEACLVLSHGTTRVSRIVSPTALMVTAQRMIARFS
jgi:hypothetical protein